MNWKLGIFLGSIIIVLLLLVACSAEQGPAGPVGPAGPPGPMGPVGPAGDDASANLEYVGADKCGDCHEEIYARYLLSGHAHALTKIEGGAPPQFPFQEETGGLTDPPEGYTWDEISYVNGGFGWKALFIDNRGYIITGDQDATTQYNYANEFVDAPAGWVSYHPGEEIPYDCGVCHTTGYRPEGHQDNLEGILGTWAFQGIQCEACHGPGNRHAADPYGALMIVDQSSQLCADCHTRDNPAQIGSENGFEFHNQQYEDLFNSKHFAISCVTCHDPHASTRFADEELNPDGGLVQVCEACHWQNEQKSVMKHLGVDCIDCHMPRMAFSAQGNLDEFRADIRSHQFSINPDPEAPQFSDDGMLVMPYLTLQYSCGQCHNGEFANIMSADELKLAAQGYHDLPTPTSLPTATPEPEVTGTPEAELTPTPQS
jgi:predicted CXXCH cytochrome family protein